MQLLRTNFVLHGSNILGGFFLFIHSGAIFCVLFSAILWWLKLIVVPCILSNLIAVVRLYAFHDSANSIVGFGFMGCGCFWLKFFSGREVVFYVKHPVFLSNYLIIINFISKDGGLNKTLLVFRDMLSAESFRKLRVIIKSQGVNPDIS